MIVQKDLYAALAHEFSECLVSISRLVCEKSITALVDSILCVQKVFVYGVGQTGFLSRLLSMKLGHVGVNSSFVYSETTPVFNPSDMLIVLSQSGETAVCRMLVKKAKEIGGKVVSITSSPDCSLARESDVNINIHIDIKTLRLPELSAIGELAHKNLSGAVFNIGLYVLIYDLVLQVASQKKETAESIDLRHANLQ